MVDTVREEIAGAFRLHQAGELGAAARLYQAILARVPDQADALHLLGVLRHQQRNSEAAVEMIGRAVALRPGAAAFHANLAEAYRALGQFERAAGCCRTALQLWHDYPEARINLGLALQALGRLDEAAEAYRAALALRPDDALAHTNLGNALRALGDREPALEHFRRAVALDPGLAIARTNLGQFLLDLGQPEEALPQCREAVALRSDLAEAHNNLGNVQRALGQFVEARAAYFEALRLNPGLAQAHANLGLTLQEEGRFEEAIPWLQRATELEPESTAFLGYLAEAEGNRERHADAAHLYQRMLELEPGRAGFHNGLGWHLQEQGRLDEAEMQFRTALRLQPDFAQAHVSLGGVHEERGDLTDAENCFRTALEHQPDHPGARARLATLLRAKLPPADLEALECRLADTQLGDGPRGDLLFGLAQVRDGLGEYERAADCLHQANALALANQRRQHAPYDPEEHRGFVERLIAACAPTFFARLAGAGAKTKRPVFIFGLPRSGTTLIEQVLASHSQLHGAGELTRTRLDFEAIPGLLGRTEPPLDCLAGLDARTVATLAAQHEEALRALDGGARARVVDKMPDNYMHLGLLAVLFPEATFIHCRRDMRDVAVSCWMTNFRSIRWANDLEHIRGRIREYRQLMDHWRAVLPVPIHEVDYEAAVDDLESVARRLVAACGLEWEPACLDFFRTRRPVRTASVTQVRKPVYRHSVGRWKHYEPALADLFSNLSRDAEGRPSTAAAELSFEPIYS
jgi:tetratricopeptide (TPR) repeat protein